MNIVIATPASNRGKQSRLDRRSMRGIAMTTMILIALTACRQQAPTTTAQAEDHSAQAVQEILAADRAFNDEAKAKGAGQAFADFMDATDGILIEPGGEPIKGRDAIFAAQNDNTVPSPLVWEAAEAYASKSGDFGASWGHWTYTIKAADGAPSTLKGKYVTVWRKNAQGEWKGLMDTGVSDPPLAAAVPTGPQATPPQTHPQMPPDIIEPPGPNQPGGARPQ